MESRIGELQPIIGASLNCHAPKRKLGPVYERLGPHPKRSLAAMVAYGLNDSEIARYYSISPSSVRRLRLVFRV